jgi:nucleotide-binding universal stress UspA family protein/hemerythrin-like domain-containing protein
VYQHILVPIDGSESSAMIVRNAVELARTIGARVTFLHVMRDASKDLYGEAALLRTIAPDKFEDEGIEHASEHLAKAEAAARLAGIECSSLTATGITPHRAILETAGEQDCDLIFMESHDMRSYARTVAGSETLKTLLASSVPVLVSSAGAMKGASIKTLMTFASEHQSLAAVAHGLVYVVAEALGGTAPDFKVLRAIIAYIGEYPEKRHHPLEEDFLFRAIRNRTHECDALIDELQRQHGLERDEFRKLADEFTAFEADPKARLDSFAAVALRFYQGAMTHMALEDDVLLPAAIKYLEKEDWERMEGAFAEVRDPRYEFDWASGVRPLFKRILSDETQ